MNKRMWFTRCVLLLLLGSSLFARSQQSVEKKSSGYTKILRLFNGENLDGWYTFIQNRGRDDDPKHVFGVVDGMIRISGEEWGTLTTAKEFENYRLITEFKWGEKTFNPRLTKARDSGILLHSQGKDGGSGGKWMHSIECQIIEGGTGDIIVVGDGTDKFRVTSAVANEKQGNSFVYKPGGNFETINSGRINWFGRDADWQDKLGFRGKKDVENPVGEWNRLICIADGNRLSIYLNDVLVNDAIRVNPESGHIQIQSEGAEIFFRKVELTFLP